MVHGSRDSASFETIVITRDTTTFENPATDVQMASFRKTLREARVIVGSVQSLQVDPLRPVEVPSGDFQEMIGKAPKGSVIVSFMGPPPLLSSAQRRRLEETKPAIVAFCPGSIFRLCLNRACCRQRSSAGGIRPHRPPGPKASRHGLIRRLLGSPARTPPVCLCGRTRNLRGGSHEH